MSAFTTNITCPYCRMPVPVVIDETAQVYTISFHSPDIHTSHDDSLMEIAYFRCHSCHRYFLIASGIGHAVKNVYCMFHPQSDAILYPDSVPLQIRQDYEEACAVINRSPKACATLARRCMQGIIHDRWNVHAQNLYAEIDALKGIIPQTEWNAMHALRQTGNIGAHMEQDVNLIIEIQDAEARLILNMVEYLIQRWYIDIAKNENTLQQVIDLNRQKQNQRHKKD